MYAKKHLLWNEFLGNSLTSQDSHFLGYQTIRTKLQIAWQAKRERLEITQGFDTSWTVVEAIERSL